MAETQDTAAPTPREAGYYWLLDKERAGGNLFIAKWDGEYWTFVNSLHMVEEEELDDPEASDARRIMDRYRIIERVREPLP